MGVDILLDLLYEYRYFEVNEDSPIIFRDVGRSIQKELIFALYYEVNYDFYRLDRCSKRKLVSNLG